MNWNQIKCAVLGHRYKLTDWHKQTACISCGAMSAAMPCPTRPAPPMPKIRQPVDDYEKDVGERIAVLKFAVSEGRRLIDGASPQMVDAIFSSIESRIKRVELALRAAEAFSCAVRGPFVQMTSDASSSAHEAQRPS